MGRGPGRGIRSHYLVGPPRTIGSPAVHENAVAKAGMFEGAPMARNGSGA